MPFNWKSNYKLPLSFIIFFVLMFFLIGEQLVALPTYFAKQNSPTVYFGMGPKGGNGKPHILDTALTDAIHRPFVYVIIGAVIWGLFRIFAWPIVWTLGSTLWTLNHLLLIPLDRRPIISGFSSLVIYIIQSFIIFGILTLVPFFIYRAVAHRWGAGGTRLAIWIGVAINLLLLGFFTLQIYVLGNSRRGLPESRWGKLGTSSVSEHKLPPNTCPERLIEIKDNKITAYLYGKTFLLTEEDQKWVEANCPGVSEEP